MVNLLDVGWHEEDRRELANAVLHGGAELAAAGADEQGARG